MLVGNNIKFTILCYFLPLKKVVLKITIYLSSHKDYAFNNNFYLVN